MPYHLWDVGGKFIIPGTRKTAQLPKVRIGDVSRQAASKHLAKILNEKFARDLRGDHKFSDGFALGNLQWKDFVPKAPTPTETA
jgi:hypothetical protein